MKTCKHCDIGFEITADDQTFYKKIDVPEPTLCPDCRQQRRAAFRNELNLYRRKCDATGKEIISMYQPTADAIIYSPEIWWGDTWNPLDYGQEFNFNRPFFEQFSDLRRKVPRLSLYGKANENSDYTNHSDHAKNSYLCADVGFSEDIYYSKWIINCRDLVDCYQLEKSEQCYQSLYSVGAYESKFIYLADESIDSDFLYNCKSVKNSLMCWNLRQKEYCIENKPHSKDEYERVISSYDTGSYKNLERYKLKYQDLIRQAVRKYAELTNCEDCTGDYLYNCKNVHDSYSVIESRDCRYCYDSGHMNDCYDTYESAFDCELQYESHACNRGKFLVAASVCYDVSNISYCEMCHNSENLFGCIGLRHKKYCILNKQYSKEEYEELVPKIIAHMKKTGEWGEFFPVELSYFAYNESAAPEFYPMTKDDVLRKGWKWYEDQKNYQKQTYEIPDHIKSVKDNIIDEVLACKTCEKNYRIISKELAFYRKNNLPIPRICPQCRYCERLKWRNPYKLYGRKCGKCGAGIQTTYSPDRPEKVYCEACFLKEVY
jgi:hypothetical protein